MKSNAWFESVNSLVIRSHGRVVAWTAYCLSPPPTIDLSQQLPIGAQVVWLVDTCVAESERGKGWAGILMDQRLAVAEEAGCCMAIGACANDNEPMRRLLHKRGFTTAGQALFPGGKLGMYYTKQLGV